MVLVAVVTGRTKVSVLARLFPCAGLWLLSALAVVPVRAAEAYRQPVAKAYRQPVYVGAKACGECHDGKAMGDQLTSWLHSRHAKAYTSLAKPEARQIAKWSGIPMEPQESAMCLGCHATASEAEPWERDDTFSIREGVQCEMCHGPGSEYMDADVMMNREAAMHAGLKMPTKEFCLELPRREGLAPDRARTADLRPGQGVAGNRPRHTARIGNSRNSSRLHRRVPSRRARRTRASPSVPNATPARRGGTSSASGGRASMRMPMPAWAPPRPARWPSRPASPATRGQARNV